MTYYDNSDHRYWESLTSPEAYDASRADEMAKRGRHSRLAILALVLGLALQGGCWRFVLSDDYNAYGVLPILLSGLAGLWALQAAVGLSESAKKQTIRKPRMEIDEAIAREQERLRLLRTQLIDEMVPHVQSWFEREVELAVREQYKVTQVVGGHLSELKREVTSLQTNVKTLLERELANSALWEKAVTADWEAAAARVGRELLRPMKRAGYQIESKPQLAYSERWNELSERLSRVKTLHHLKEKRAAERAWRGA